MQTRRRLIEVALTLSADKSFSALSLREIAAAAGLTPAAFYRHFKDLEDLGLVLLDEVGLSLRQLLREARRRVDSKKGSVEASIETFLEYVNDNSNLFRLLLGERQGASYAFRKSIHAEIDRFVNELSEDLSREAQVRQQPISNPPFAAEAIVAVVFTVGAEALDLPKHKQAGLSVRLVEEVKMILRGSRLSSVNRGRGKSTKSLANSRSKIQTKA